MAEKSALVIVFDGVEEIEALAPVDIFRRAGIKTVVAAIGESKIIKGRNNIRFEANQMLSDTDAKTFDITFLPGGPGVLKQADNAGLLALLKSLADSGKRLAAICAAPKVLAKAGILDKVEATSHASVRKELPHPSEDPIVADQNIITSQGAGTAIPFALRVVEELCGKDAAKEIADSIHY